MDYLFCPLCASSFWYKETKLKSIEESVIASLDGTDKALFPYLPYILQDLWELGASPGIILNLIQKHVPQPANLNILDLGCGKGAVSIHLAKELHCSCDGIDAVPEFVEEAQQKAKAYGVEDRCRFETHDIRKQVCKYSGYDMIILGAIGPVWGNYHKTLTTLSRCIHQQGGIIIDDAFIDDHSDFTHPSIEKRSTILTDIQRAGMILVDEYIMNPGEVKQADEAIFARIEARCQELMNKYPEQRLIFEDYLDQQEEENDVLERKARCTTMFIKKKKKY